MEVCSLWVLLVYCLFWVYLSVPVQLTASRDSFLTWLIVCLVGHKTLLSHSCFYRIILVTLIVLKCYINLCIVILVKQDLWLKAAMMRHPRDSSKNLCRQSHLSVMSKYFVIFCYRDFHVLAVYFSLCVRYVVANYRLRIKKKKIQQSWQNPRDACKTKCEVGLQYISYREFVTTIAVQVSGSLLLGICQNQR